MYLSELSTYGPVRRAFSDEILPWVLQLNSWGEISESTLFDSLRVPWFLCPGLSLTVLFLRP